MATVGNITAIFSADTSKLKKGVDTSVGYFADLRKEIEALNKETAHFGDIFKAQAKVAEAALNKMNVEANARINLDTSSVEQGAKDVQKFNRDVESTSPTVAVRANTKPLEKSLQDLGKGVKSEVKATVEEKDDKKKEKYETTFLGRFRQVAVETFKKTGDESLEAASKFTKMRDTATATGEVIRKGYSSVTEAAEKAGKAVEGIGAALSASGKLGREGSDGLIGGVDALVVATGRSVDAITSFREMIQQVPEAVSGAMAGVVVFANQIGGFDTVMQAARGSTAATVVILSSLGSALVAAATGFATYAAVLALARASTQGLSVEAQGYVDTAAAGVGATAALVVGTRVGKASYDVLAEAIANATGVADFFQRIIGGVTTGVQTAAEHTSVLANGFSMLYTEFGLIAAAADEHTTLFTFGAAIAEQVVFAAALGAASASFGLYASGVRDTGELMQGAIVGAAGALEHLRTHFDAVIVLSTLAAVATGRFVEQIEHIGERVNQAANLMDRFGSSTEEIDKMRISAAAAGTSVNQLVKAQQAFYTNISKIKAGQFNVENVREAKMAFDKLNISIEELKNAKPQDVFRTVAQAITAVEDPADKTAIAFDLFGRQGAQILPVLKKFGTLDDDFKRLGGSLSEVDFERFERADDSFVRLRTASQNLGQVLVLPFVEVQTAVNNAAADINGGLVAAIGPLSGVIADATKTLSVLIEVFGRIGNIILRIVGVLSKFYAAMSFFAQTSRFVTALAEGFNQLALYIERAVDVASQFMDVLGNSMNAVIDECASLATTIYETGRALVIAIAFTGAFDAALLALGVDVAAILAAAGTAFMVFAQRVYASLTLAGIQAFVVGTVTLLYTATVSMYTFAAQGVQAALTWLGGWVFAGASFITGFVVQIIAGSISAITGLNAAAIAAQVASLSFAASFTIATLGLGLILLAIAAVVTHFDDLYDYFTDFSGEMADGFTFEGMSQAFAGAISAMRETMGDFVAQALEWLGFITSGTSAIFATRTEAPKIDAAASTPEEIARNRRATTLTEARNAQAVKSNAGVFGMLLPDVEIPAPEDFGRITKAVEDARGSIADLSIEAAKFGTKGKDAAKNAADKFAKLQKQLSENTIDVTQFEAAAKKIQRDFKSDIDLSDVITPEQKIEFSRSVFEAVQNAKKSLRELSSGTVVEGKFFPTSDKIKDAAQGFLRDYNRELAAIDKKFQLGGFGKGKEGADAAAIAKEEADRSFKRNTDLLGRDTSFADDIRKKLEEAFLTPVQKLQKELRKIATNRSLTDIEASLAAVEARKQAAESMFGKTRGQQASEKRDMLGEITGVNGGLGAARAAAEQRKADAERSQSLGLTQMPSDQLAAGLDKVNDEFDTFGMTMLQVQAKLSPKELAMWNESLKKSKESIRESIGVEKRGSEIIAESQKKLDDAFKAGVITATERDVALTKASDGVKQSLGVMKPSVLKLSDDQRRLSEALREGTITTEEFAEAEKKAKESFAESLGVKKTPFETFENMLDKISVNMNMAGKTIAQIRAGLKGSPEMLALFERALKDARNSLLDGLGVGRTPQEIFRQTMGEIKQAEASQDPDKNITAEQANKARRTAAAKRAEALGAGDSVFSFQNKIRDQVQDLFSVNDSIEKERRRLNDKTFAKFQTGLINEKTLRKQLNENNKNAKSQLNEFGLSPDQMAAGRKKILEQIPGADKENPLQKFNEEMRKLNSVRGLLGQEDFAKRKLNLQAELQEGLKPALASVMPDTRAIQAADLRSKGGVDTFFRILSGQNNPSLKAQIEIANNTKMLVQAAQQPDAAPVIAQLAKR